MKNRKNNFALGAFLVCVFLLAVSPSATAQRSVSPQTKKDAPLKFVETAISIGGKVNSKLMGREMPYQVILPPAYQKQSATRFPVLYLLHGLGGRFDNWTAKTKLTGYAARHEIIIIAVEGENGWYTDGVANPNDRYESYIIEELISEIDKKYRTNGERDGRGIAGLSMGGYGAIKFGLKYPDKFAFAGSMSGALGAASFSGTQMDVIGGVLKTSIERAFGAAADTETRRANDIFKIIREMPDEQKAKLPFLYLDCGTEDFLYASNREFSELLRQKRVRHEFRQLPGNHEWSYWDKQIQEILRLSESSLLRLSRAAKPEGNGKPVF